MAEPKWGEPFIHTPQAVLSVRCVCDSVIVSDDGDEWKCTECGRTWGVTVTIAEVPHG